MKQDPHFYLLPYVNWKSEFLEFADLAESGKIPLGYTFQIEYPHKDAKGFNLIHCGDGLFRLERVTQEWNGWQPEWWN